MENIEQFLEQRKKFRKRNSKVRTADASKQKSSFFDKIFRQLIVTMGLFICIFTIRLFPITQGIFYQTQAAVCIDYSQEVKSVFNGIKDKVKST